MRLTLPEVALLAGTEAAFDELLIVLLYQDVESPIGTIDVHGGVVGALGRQTNRLA